MVGTRAGAHTYPGKILKIGRLRARPRVVNLYKKWLIGSSPDVLGGEPSHCGSMFACRRFAVKGMRRGYEIYSGKMGGVESSQPEPYMDRHKVVPSHLSVLIM